MRGRGGRRRRRGGSGGERPQPRLQLADGARRRQEVLGRVPAVARVALTGRLVERGPARQDTTWRRRGGVWVWVARGDWSGRGVVSGYIMSS